MALIGLYDQDYVLGKSEFPNLALMKISTYHKKIGDSVSFITRYTPELFTTFYIACESEDFRQPKSTISDNVKLVGSFFCGGAHPKLPPEIMKCKPDMSLYENTSVYRKTQCSFWALDDEGNIRKGFEEEIDFSNKLIQIFIVADKNMTGAQLKKVIEIIKANIQRHGFRIGSIYPIKFRDFQEYMKLESRLRRCISIVVRRYAKMDEDIQTFSNPSRRPAKFTLIYEGVPETELVQKIAKLFIIYIKKETSLPFYQWVGYHYGMKSDEMKQFSADLKNKSQFLYEKFLQGVKKKSEFKRNSSKN